MIDERVALVAKALAHPARVHIVRLLSEQSECRGHDVFAELPLAQSTISQHLSVLKDAGLVRSHPAGTAMVYCLVPSVLEDFNDAVGSIATCAVECAPETEGC
jgi:ArsR family transcriptional regulator